MPLTLSKLRSKEATKTATMEWEGETLAIKYRDAFPPLFYQLQSLRIQAAKSMESGKGVKFEDAANMSDALATVMASMIIEWDLMDDGDMYPLTFNTLAVLPLDFLFAVFDAIAGGTADPNARKTARRSRNT